MSEIIFNQKPLADLLRRATYVTARPHYNPSLTYRMRIHSEEKDHIRLVLIPENQRGFQALVNQERPRFPLAVDLFIHVTGLYVYCFVDNSKGKTWSLFFHGVTPQSLAPPIIPGTSMSQENTPTLEPGTFRATLLDAFATAQLMWVNEERVESMEIMDGGDRELFMQMNSTFYCTTKPADHLYTFVNGKTSFTDSRDALCTVELFRLVPMTSLEDQ